MNDAGATASDSDAQAFLTAAGITDATIVSAIDNFVIALKAASIWTKFKYIYPFVGGVASAHKYNLKSPVDADANFRLVFGSAVTHSANGITASTANGTNNIVETKFVPNTEYADKNVSFGALCHSAPDVNNAPNGSFQGATATGSSAFPRFSRGANATEWVVGMGGNVRTLTVNFSEFVVVSNTTTLVGGQSANTAQCYLNGSASGASISTSTGTLPTVQHYLLRYNSNGTVNGTCQFTLKFAFAATFLTASEIASLSTAVANLQTALGR